MLQRGVCVCVCAGSLGGLCNHLLPLSFELPERRLKVDHLAPDPASGASVTLFLFLGASTPWVA